MERPTRLGLSNRQDVLKKVCCFENTYQFLYNANVYWDLWGLYVDHSVQKLIVIFNKLLITFDCFLSLYDIHAYIKSLE